MTLWQKFKSTVEGTTAARQPVTAEEKADIEQYTADGWTITQISEQLDRPIKTVQPYVQAIRKRMEGSAPVPIDPVREYRIELEKVRLETEKIKLEMERDRQKHEQRMQELEYAEELQGEDDGPELIEDQGLKMFVDFLGTMKARNTPPPAAAIEPPRSTISEPPVAAEPPKPKKPHKAAISAETLPISPEQEESLVRYIRLMGWNKEEAVAQGLKRGISKEVTEKFYDEKIGK